MSKPATTDLLEWDPRSWWSDTRCLSPESRAVWFDLLILMHYANPRGYLVDRQGNKLTDDFLCRQLRVAPNRLHLYLSEIRNKGVCSIDSAGRIYCRRMVRDRQPGESLKSAAHRVQQNPPQELREWIEWWNGLAAGGHVVGYHTASKPPIELCRAWVRIQKMPEVREHLKRRTELAEAIKNASFVKRWITLAALFGGKNGDGEYKVRKLLEGHYADERTPQSDTTGNTRLLETMQRFAARGS